jgi:hypothetical protein
MERKFTYWLVVQGDYGCGWEDLEHIDLHGERTTIPGVKKPVGHYRYARYIQKEAGGKTRIIHRRERKEPVLCEA